MARRATLSIIAAALLAVTFATPALAHKLKTFVTVEGPDLVGIAYFSPGGRANEIAVTLSAPDGTVLGRTRTDQSGNFRIPAKQGVDNIVTVDGGDGHAAGFTVTVADLTGRPRPSADQATPAIAAPTAAEDIVERTIARQIRPLREELNAFQEKVWMHDILGGLGIIAGIGGIVFGLSERRRARQTIEGDPAKKRGVA